ncbi:alpha-glucuronidase family glycosyl hydrolase [Chryseolinea lacunae]|uniref:Xylan alpha-1,2-glucuronidase n=1 Tax=Chryseolinea lacunae TaxID=2801331 RepID=A0ABS1KZ76_9BACT|nr:alpha-glucuronidase family glycosyl hydrolase [Chryseolinea lacunae]MBL0744537.1 alpha-glucuronidase [Chryseolinea lacunae]
MSSLTRVCFVLCLSLSVCVSGFADDGYELWLSYRPLADATVVKRYKAALQTLVTEYESPTLTLATHEITRATAGLLKTSLVRAKTPAQGSLLLGTPRQSPLIASLNLASLATLGDEGFVIVNTTVKGKPCIVIAANTDVGMLYGTFHFIRLLQTQQSIQNLSVAQAPVIQRRILNHWDNLDRTVERGYAGFSLWDWHKLPDYIDPRYHAYARANASIGINGTVLTNVNANAQILTEPYLRKVKALADVFRPYGLKVYLTARFSAPVEIGGLSTADPLDPAVKAWWKKKIDEIYTYVPDFGGFCVKANSEGQPGPQNYNRSHADGANLFAEMLAPHGGIVMWRAFVYSNETPDDRAKQAYTEFKPLDGKFNSNALVQVKNGAIDFQPREPFHPLFGAMPKTPLMLEFQLTQEYLGFATHLVYLAPLFKETLDADTYAKGKGSQVSKVVDGSLDHHTVSAMAGVANIGNDRNWCGHPFGQANWYAYGRLAWNHALTAEAIADEWIRMTFSNDPSVITPVKAMMLSSREIAVQYMTPLGLHHIMGYNHHYGPGPWIRDKPRADWTSVYYHQADSLGVGFDRTKTGSDALSQYAQPVQDLYGPLANCPEKYLLWFHHLPWDHKLKSGKSLWDEICFAYYHGADSARWMQQQWNLTEHKVDDEQFQHVKSLLAIQHQEAVWWRNACVVYFQTFSRQPIPAGLEKPDHTLPYYEGLEFPFAPGIRPKW